MPIPTEPDDFWVKNFGPVAAEIGFLLREWNWLHEKLGDLFCTIIADTHPKVSRAIWYSVPNDRNQRGMLKAAASIAFSHDTPIFQEIDWLLEQTRLTGTQRDDAAHSPYSVVIGEPMEVIAYHFHGHPRAKNLKSKELLSEFKRYREKTVILSRYATALETYVSKHRLPGSQWVDWTQTPPLPKQPSLPRSQSHRGSGVNQSGRQEPTK
jgi:hypothetical protein